MVKEGYYYGLPTLALGGVSFLVHWYVVGIVLVFLAAFVFSFFRDPERVIPTDSGAVVSPGDGRVVVVTDEENAGRPGNLANAGRPGYVDDRRLEVGAAHVAGYASGIAAVAGLGTEGGVGARSRTCRSR